MSASYTSEDKDESSGESGYSDVESTITSDLSEVDTFSAAVEVPQKQTNTKVKPRRLKEAATKEQMKTSKETISRSIHVPEKKTAGKTKVKQLLKKGILLLLYVQVPLDLCERCLLEEIAEN